MSVELVIVICVCGLSRKFLPDLPLAGENEETQKVTCRLENPVVFSFPSYFPTQSPPRPGLPTIFAPICDPFFLFPPLLPPHVSRFSSLFPLSLSSLKYILISNLCFFFARLSMSWSFIFFTFLHLSHILFLVLFPSSWSLVFSLFFFFHLLHLPYLLLPSPTPAGLLSSKQVFERGVKAIPLSIDLWIHYINFYVDKFGQKPEGYSKIRRLVHSPKKLRSQAPHHFSHVAP